MLTVTGPFNYHLYRFLEWAIIRKRPVSLTYRKQAKDAQGRLRWDTLEGARVPVLEVTTRTIEPWAIEKPGEADAYVRGMDRDSGEARSWRLDRIDKITYHKRGKQIIPAYVSLSNTKRS